GGVESPIKTITANVATMRAVTARIFVICIAILHYTGCLFETQVQLLFRPVHIFFEIFLPDLCPWAAEHIRDSVFDHLARSNLGRVAIDWVERPRTFRPSEAAGCAPGLLVISVPQDTHGLCECLRIVNDRFPIDADELAGAIPSGGQDLDCFEFIAPF